jgi:hypothetical protein
MMAATRGLWSSACLARSACQPRCRPPFIRVGLSSGTDLPWQRPQFEWAGACLDERQRGVEYRVDRGREALAEAGEVLVAAPRDLDERGDELEGRERETGGVDLVVVLELGYVAARRQEVVVLQCGL